MKRKFFYIVDGKVEYCENRSILLLKATRAYKEGMVKRVMEGADHWRVKEIRGDWWIWESDLGREWVYAA